MTFVWKAAMHEINSINKPLVEIVPPSAVAPPLDATMVVLSIAALVFVLALAFFYWNRPKQQACRKIQLLIRQDWIQDQQRRDGCHLIARELGKAFEVPRLPLVRFDDIRQQEWEAFLHLLDRKRFSEALVSSDELIQLANQAMHWLKVRSWNT